MNTFDSLWQCLLSRVAFNHLSRVANTDNLSPPIICTTRKPLLLGRFLAEFYVSSALKSATSLLETTIHCIFSLSSILITRLPSCHLMINMQNSENKETFWFNTHSNVGFIILTVMRALWNVFISKLISKFVLDIYVIKVFNYGTNWLWAKFTVL